MKGVIPRKRVILAIHRWLGASAALFLVILAITGLLLNHSEALGLNRIHVKSSLVRSMYGMADGKDILSYRIHNSDTISSVGGRLYYNGKFLANADTLIGIHQSKNISIIASSNSILLVTIEGELVELIDRTGLPFEQIIGLGLSEDGNAVVVSGSGAWKADKDWIGFTRHEDNYKVISPQEVELAEETVDSVLADFQGSGPVLSKVLLDLHSGRIFGWGGRTLMNLTAIAILLLVTSGISGWLRKSSREK